MDLQRRKPFVLSVCSTAEPSLTSSSVLQALDFPLLLGLHA